jgi:hypothetical protein
MSTTKQVYGFPMYDIASDGAIYSRLTNRWLKPLVLPNGYRHVVLTNQSGKHRRAVHRLVAEAFLGQPPMGRVVNHKNGDRADNRAENLEWVTQSENVSHTYRSGRRVISQGQKDQCAALGRAKRSTDAVIEAKALAMLSGRRGDQARVSTALGVSRYVVARIARGAR